MPGTARHFGMLNAAVDERRDPAASAQGAASLSGQRPQPFWKLATRPDLLLQSRRGRYKRAQTFGNDFVAIARNYSGAGFGFASRNFYTEFLAAREIARDPQRFFPEGIHYEPPLNLDRVRLRQTVNVMTLANYYAINAWELTSLNKAWNPAAQNS